MRIKNRGRSPLIAVLAAALILAACGTAGALWWNSARTGEVIKLIAIPIDSATPRTSTSAAMAAAKSVVDNPAPMNGSAISVELGSADPNVRRGAIAQIRELASGDARSLAVNFPQWAQRLLNCGEYQEVERWSQIAILQRPYDTPVVQSAQRARVLALLAQKKLLDALWAAKSYCDVADLGAAAGASDLLSQIQGRISNSPGDPSSGKLPGISAPPADYENAVTQLEGRVDRRGKYSFNNLMGRGNLLLLADKPAGARVCFEEACKLAGGSGRNLRLALDGVVRSMRAQDGEITRASAYIASIAAESLPAAAGLQESGSPSVEELRVAALTIIADAGIAISTAPPLEQLREDAESATASEAPARIVSGFEGSSPAYVATVSPTHLVVELTTPGYRDWFMFRVEGAAGRTVRIDVTGGYKTVANWSQHEWSVDPVYADAGDLADPVTYACRDVADSAVRSAWNGPPLSSTAGQQWHYIQNVWSDAYTLSFVQKFDADSVVVAMRVPYTAAYNERYLEGLSANPMARVVQIGRSAKNRPLSAVVIGGEGAPSAKHKPCVLLYAGEHADEPDASWVAQGAVEYLIGDSAEAQRLRERFTFVFIPLLDPDGSAAAIHEGMIVSFVSGRTTPESIAYANFFQSWINSGKRLDLVFDLHNVQSSEGPHVFCALMEGNGARGTAAAALHGVLISNLSGTNLVGRAAAGQRGWMPDRLGGWLTRYYGALTMAYEVNSQAPDRHLNLSELRGLGGVFVSTAGQFLAGADATPLLGEIDRRRAERAARWSAHGERASSVNAILSEAAALQTTAAPVSFELDELALR